MAVITSNNRFMAIGNGNGADMFTSGLEYDGSAISGYSGSAFYQAPQTELSAGNGISITETGNTAVIAFTGDVPVNYSAGKNLNLADNTFALNDTVVLGTQVSGATLSQGALHVETPNNWKTNMNASGFSATRSLYSAVIDPTDVKVYTPAKTYSLTGMTPFTGIYKNSANFVGNGTTTSRLDLNSSVWVSWSIGARQSDDEKAAVNFNGLSVTHTASGVGGGSINSTYGETYNIMFNDGEQYLKKAWLTKSGYSIHDYGNYGQGSAFYGPHSASFHDSLGQVYYNADSIRRWDAVSQMNHDSNLSGDVVNTPLGLNSSISLDYETSLTQRHTHFTPGRVTLIDSTRTAWYYAAFASLESPTKSSTYGAGYLQLADSTHTDFREITPATIDQWNSMNHIRVTAENEYIDISDQSWCLVSFDENISKAYIAGKRANGYLAINSGHWYMFGDAKKNNQIWTHLVASGNATTTYI